MENKDTTEKFLSDRVKNLIELSRIDTLFGDIYLDQAQELLQEKMPLETFRGFQRLGTELVNLPNRIHRGFQVLVQKSFLRYVTEDC